MTPAHHAVDQVVKATPAGVRLAVKVVPGASRSRVAGVLGDRLKVQVAAPPEGGKANAAVCALLAACLGVSPKAVSVSAGHTQPRKSVDVDGIGVAAAVERLRAAV